jgi:ABC-type polysaccharide/polyol phosphate export permease
MNIFFHLIHADMRAFKSDYIPDMIDIVIYISVVTLVAGYMMPLVGVQRDFVLLTFTGTVGSAVSFRAFPNISMMVSDLSGDRSIEQRLILPIPAWLMLTAKVCSLFLMGLAICAWVFPVGLLLLWNTFPFENFSIWRVALIMILACSFFSALTLFMASIINTPQQIGRVWGRALFPLWFFGGLQFTWQKLHDIFPAAAYIDLLNPYLLAIEGTRAAMVGQDGNLPYWYCAFGLFFLTLLALIVGVKRLRNKLDYVVEHSSF